MDASACVARYFYVTAFGVRETARAARECQQEQHEVSFLRQRWRSAPPPARVEPSVPVVEQRHPAQAQQQHTHLGVNALERADLSHRLLRLELHEFGAIVVVANGGTSNFVSACGDPHSRKAAGHTRVTWQQQERALVQVEIQVER